MALSLLDMAAMDGPSQELSGEGGSGRGPADSSQGKGQGGGVMRGKSLNKMQHGRVDGSAEGLGQGPQ
jgi:hypothetical protein